MWAQVDPDRISESWAEQLPAAVSLTTAGQMAAATQTNDYVSGRVRVEGGTPKPDARVNPAGFAGHTAAGEQLASLLYLPAIESKRLIGLGRSPRDAMLSGLANLITYTHTEVADAGRLGTQVAMTTEREITGYTRVVNVPACGRCIVLAGKFYKTNTGFQRHPRCDCTHEPTTTHREHAEAEAFTTRQSLVDSMSEADRRKAFTVDGARAIEDGADISQVVNSRFQWRVDYDSPKGARTRIPAGMASPGARYTNVDTNLRYERAKERGVKPLQVGPRMTVHEIYRVAGDDRDRAMELLFQNAYIV